jgi:type IV pilus assembly protein PilA
MLHFFAKRLREMQEVRRDERGFTLIELLVVVIIIGVLAAIAIPIFLAQQRRAEVATCQSDARNAGAAASSYRAANNGSYLNLDVDALEAQGFNPTNNTAGNYPVQVTTATANEAVITVGCKGSGVATFTASTGVVTSPAS